jgi:DNA invertase Pin-like site-specific DNA recombinase
MGTDSPATCVAYARVSTLLGQDPQHQLVPIKAFADARGFKLVDEYIDIGISGSKERRPELDRLISDARRGKFKIVICAALDRLGRDTRNLLNLLHELNRYGVSVISLRENLDFSTAIGQAALTILGAISQMERQFIGERIKTALAAKKLTAKKTGSGWRCGRKSVATNELVAEILHLRGQGLSIRAIEKALSPRVSRPSISRILKQNHAVSKTQKNDVGEKE